MKIFLTALILLIYLQTFGQGEANNWFFGKNAGINFNTIPPTAVTGSLNTIEGCASISDKNGNLLFYTDGTVVYDNSHSLMTNGFGLNGNPSSTQSAIIIPKPEDANTYYIFTVEDQNGDGRGLQYSVVDISKNEVTLKNQPLIGFTSEKVTAVRSSDCNYWVITYKLGSFYVYKVDASGINTTPIPNNNGFYMNTDGRGYLKVSPDGKKIAIAHQGNQKLLLYDFNDATGTISNEIELPLIAPNDRPYGVEFSASGKRLYCAASNDFYSNDYNEWNNPINHTSALYQFNLEATDITSTSVRTILDQRTLYRSALQLAPNGKIYRSLSSTYNIGINQLGVINNPEGIGVESDYEHNGINLGSNLSTQGLPPFIASFLLPIEITDTQTNNLIQNSTVNVCIDGSFEMAAETVSGSPTYTWEFTDSNGLNSYFTGQTLSISNISFDNAGSYKLKVETQDACSGVTKIYESTVELKVHENPKIIPNITFEQCDFDSNPVDGKTLFNLTTKEPELTDNAENVEVSFYEMSDSSLNTPVNKQAYTNLFGPNHTLQVKVENTITGCSTIGTINLTVLPTSLTTYDNVFACENNLNENNPDAFKSKGNGFGTFNFDEIQANIESIFPLPITVEFYNNSYDASLQINKITGIQKIQPQEVFVRIENEATKSCLGGGTFNLFLNPLPEPKGSNTNQILCVNNPKDTPQEKSILLDGSTGSSSDTYQWYFNNNLIPQATNPTLAATKEGIYRVEASRYYENNSANSNDDVICVGYNSFKVIESNFPVISENNLSIIDDSINNSVTINTDNLGLGNYEYALNYPSGSYQDEPYFEGLEAGIHTVFVRDKNKCGYTSLPISIVGYPRFFTPNGDGENDTWIIKGVNENFYPNSKIYIFNRFGKLVAEIDPKGIGWDGIFNGELLPASDYWFSVELIDNNGNSKIRKGHFSLIRR